MSSVPVTVHSGIAYGQAKLADIYCPPTPAQPPVVLLWHGSGHDERDVLGPLARAIASEGCAVVVPDWQPEAAELRRKQLVSSIGFVLSEGNRFGWSSRVVVGGWSLGASAAADVVLHPEIVDGWRPVGLVGIAGPYLGSPIREGSVAEHITGDRTVPCLLVHGARDTTVAPDRSRELHRLLAADGWSTSIEEPDADHASVIGTRYHPLRHRCMATKEPSARIAMRAVAESVAALAAGD